MKFVVSFAAGGSNDIIARVLCEWLSEHFGQQFIVENRPGGSGNVGAASVLNSTPDGYTLMFVGPNNAISASVFKKLPFDFLRDSQPIGGIMLLTNIMVVPNSLPVNTVAEFIAYAKANQGKINMASPGAGTSPHLSGELFKLMTGIEMQHIPYRGAGPAYPDLITGKTQVFFDNLPGSVELVKSGQLKALAVTQDKRSFVFPDLPTIGETVPGYDVSLYYGVSGPKGIPPDDRRDLEQRAADRAARPEDAAPHRRVRRHAALAHGGRVRQARVGRDGAMGEGGGDDRVVD